MNVEVDLDETEVPEPAGKKVEKGRLSLDVLSLCADDAASKAAREVMALMTSDSDMREQRQVGE